jgi:hypothetical protein
MLKISHSARRVALAALMLALAHASGAVLAQEGTMYSWTDENGVVHFSDRKPEGLEVQAQALPETPKTGTVSPVQEGEGQPSVAEQRREALAQKREDNRARQQETSANCAAWNAELERLEPNRRVFYTDDEGETVRMDDVVRTDRVAELHKLIDENCP